MPDYLQLSETTLRFMIFAGVFLLMAGLEILWPKRKLIAVKYKRWMTNLSIAGLGAVLLRLIAASALPLVALSAAQWATSHHWGLFQILNWPFWLEMVCALLILDFAIYLQHLASHKIPALWRFHRVHHADLDFDVTTGVRFHPIEIGLSMLYKVVLIVLLGPPVLAVFVFEVTLNALALFNHTNLNLPPKFDRLLRQIIVTPDMHRVHHSIHKEETDSNYGFNLSLWDRVFKTYIPQPRDGHIPMTVGLEEYQTQEPVKLGWSLLLPFQKKKLHPELTQDAPNQTNLNQKDQDKPDTE